MAKKKQIDKRQLSFDAFLVAKPTAPIDPKSLDPSKSRSRGDVTKINGAAPASISNKGNRRVIHHEGTPMETGYGNAVVMQPRGKIVDLSKYTESKKKNIKNDGCIYFCRNEKKHFTGPVIINNSIMDNDPFWDVLTCPDCGSAMVVRMNFEKIPDKDFCLTCGCLLEIDIRDNATKICYNCNRDVFALKLKRENQK